MQEVLRARWIAWRNALIGAPRFQRFAADFPPFRAIARRRAESLFDIVAGFVYAQTLYLCVTLGVLERLRAGPLSAAELAAGSPLDPAGCERLLRAAAALDLVEQLGPRWALGAQGAALLGQPGLGAMIRHHAHFYRDMADPLAVLKAGRADALAAFWPYATDDAPRALDAEAVGAYSALMAATQPAVAADVLAAYPMRGHRVLMDVGGGEGVFLRAAGARWPHLRLRLFDLPAVAARAAAAQGPPIETHGGDFLADPLPPGADLISLIRILHDHDDSGAAALVRASRAALGPGGALLIAEPMAGGARPARMGDAYFGFYLAAMGRGRTRTPAELIELTRESGFSRARLLRTRTPALLRAVVAKV